MQDGKDVLNINGINPSILSSLNSMISRKLDKSGIYSRVFFRIKSQESTKKKLETGKYSSEKKIQDIIGGRIVLYFIDDISICKKLIEQLFTILDVSEDIPTADEFKPTRLNFVCKIPNECMAMISNDLWNSPIDSTFEIQIRTIFSEGWHEVEHDLRYKCKFDWENNLDLSRNLNGILATLETCDWAIMNIFAEMSHRKYKQGLWESMLRSKFRIRFKDHGISDNILPVVREDAFFWKNIFRIDREDFITKIAANNFPTLPTTFDNVIYCANEIYGFNDPLSLITPSLIKEMVIPFKNLKS